MQVFSGIVVALDYFLLSDQAIALSNMQRCRFVTLWYEVVLTVIDQQRDRLSSLGLQITTN